MKVLHKNCIGYQQVLLIQKPSKRTIFFSHDYHIPLEGEVIPLHLSFPKVLYAINYINIGGNFNVIFINMTLEKDQCLYHPLLPNVDCTGRLCLNLPVEFSSLGSLIKETMFYIQNTIYTNAWLMSSMQYEILESNQEKPINLTKLMMLKESEDRLMVLVEPNVVINYSNYTEIEVDEFQ